MIVTLVNILGTFVNTVVSFPKFKSNNSVM